MTETRTPEDLQAALEAVPEAQAKWSALPEPARVAYLQWVDGQRFLRHSRIKGTVSRVLHDRPQLGLVGRLREGAGLLGDAVKSGDYPPYTGAGTGS